MLNNTEKTNLGSWQLETKLPLDLQGLSAHHKDGKLYVIGGTSKGLSFSDKVSIYHMKEKRWETGATMPHGGGYSASVMVEDKIYIFGGILTTNPGHINFDYSNVVQIYDTTKNTWSIGASMLSAVAYTAAVVRGSDVYVFGGYLNNQTSLSKVQVYNIPSNTWRSESDMPFSLGRHSAHVYEDKVYLIGGSEEQQKNGCKNIRIYDFTSKIWSKSTMDTNRASVTSVLYNNKIYILGGADNYISFDSTLIYDIATDTYSPFTKLTKTICLSASVIIDHKIYLIGGRVSHGSSSSINSDTVESHELPDCDECVLEVCLKPNETVQLSVNEALSENKNMIWTSSNVNAAVVDDNGLVTAKATGRTTITSTSKDDSTDTGTIHIYVE